ncbi:MAG: helix-turn-helix transcriptional regulator [Gemmatimonadaceae bacterium]
MTEDASDRLRRLLSVIPLFAEDEGITHEELERRTGVPAAQLLDDLQAVTERLDTPGAFVEDLRVEFERDRVFVYSSHFLRPMRLTVPELCALELGLALLAAATAPDERAPIDSARSKLRKAIVAMPAMPRDDPWHVPNDAHAGPVAAALQRAAKGTHKVRITYQSSSAAQATARVIHPYALQPSHGTWFVIAHCEASAAIRFFRADRISAIEPLGETFTRPESLPILQLIRSGKPFQGQSGDTLVIRYSPRIARWIAEREGKPLDADGSLIVTHSLADDSWAVRHVLQYGAEAEVLSPERVRQRVKETLQQLLG